MSNRPLSVMWTFGVLAVLPLGLGEAQNVELLSAHADLAAALTAVGSNGTIIIDVNETLAATSYDIPKDVWLDAAGGILKLQNGTTLTLRSTPRSDQKLFDHSNWVSRGSFHYMGTDPFNSAWFGMKGLNHPSSSSLENSRAFIGSWEASRGKSATAPGTPLEFVSDFIEMDPTDLTGLLGRGDQPIRGRKALIRLPNNADSFLWDMESLTLTKETEISDFTFDGNKGNNTVAPGTPLIRWRSYSALMSNVEIQSCPGDGMRIIQGQQYILHNFKANLCVGWGLVLDDVMAFETSGIDVEQNTLGGMRIIGNGREGRMSIPVLYAESTSPALQLEGAWGVNVGSIYNTNGSAQAVNIKLNGSRSSRNNVIHAEEASGDVTIDAGNCNNTIHYRRDRLERMKIIDNSGCHNSIIPTVGDGGLAAELGSASGVPGSSLVPDSVPQTHGVLTAGNEYIPDVVAHDSTVAGPAHLALTPTLNNTLNFQFTPTLTASTTYYYQVAAEADWNVDTWIQIIEAAAPFDAWDFATRTWVANGTQEDLHLPFSNGDVRRFEVSFVTQVGQTDAIIRIGQKNWSTDETNRVYYHSLSTTPNLELTYRRGGADRGAREIPAYPTPSLPAAGEFVSGTRAYDTTLGQWTYTDGTSWSAMGGGVGGSGATDQIAVWSGSDTLSGSTALVFDSGGLQVVDNAVIDTGADTTLQVGAAVLHTENQAQRIGWNHDPVGQDGFHLGDRLRPHKGILADGGDYDFTTFGASSDGFIINTAKNSGVPSFEVVEGGSSSLRVDGDGTVDTGSDLSVGAELDVATLPTAASGDEILARDTNNKVADAGFTIDKTVSVFFSNETLDTSGKFEVPAGGPGISHFYITLDTFASAATDDLESVGRGTVGDLLFIQTTDNSRNVVIKHNTGRYLELYVTGAADFTLDNTFDRAVFIRMAGQWAGINVSNNN